MGMSLSRHPFLHMKKIMVAIAIALFFFGLPAQASLHTYPEPTGVMYRSLSNLKDGHDRAWQAILFKRFNAGRLEALHLRLVGFPGVVQIQHPRSLVVESSGNLLSAEDVTPSNILGTNVGEYDLQPILAQLDTDATFRLTLDLQAGQETLKIPKATMQEWWRVATWSLK
jgi:hypothetical protein